MRSRARLGDRQIGIYLSQGCRLSAVGQKNQALWPIALAASLGYLIEREVLQFQRPVPPFER